MRPYASVTINTLAEKQPILLHFYFAQNAIVSNSTRFIKMKRDDITNVHLLPLHKSDKLRADE